MIGPLKKLGANHANRKAPKYRNRERAWPYMGFVKSLACCASVNVLAEMTLAAERRGESTPLWWAGAVAWHTPCAGDIEADHAGRRGIGQKASDATCIPLCRQHHRERTDHTGAWRGMNQAQARAFLIDAIAYTQSVARRRGVAVPE